MATIKDVAKRAGVSVATVSRVLNNKDRVKDETRAAIRQALEELDYHPNDLARALVKPNQSKIIAMLSVSPHHPFFAELIHHIEEALSDRGYKLLLLTSYMNEVKEKKCADLINSRIADGLIIGSFPVADPMLLRLPLPTVAIETAPGENIPYIMSNEYQGGILAARHLAAKGCKNLVMIGGLHSSLGADRRLNEREKGFIEVCSAQGLSHKIYYADTNMIQSLDFFTLINRIFFEYPQVDGILANSDYIAAEVIQIAVSQGYSVPEHLKVVGFDGTRISRIFNPPLTTVAQDIPQLARCTVETLIAMIEGRSYEAETIIPVRLIERRST